MTDRISSSQSGPSVAFYLEADRNRVEGNSSIVRCYLRAVNTGTSASYFGNAGYQAGSIDGIGEFGRRSGDPFLPSGVAAGAQRWRIGPFDVAVPHNSDGTRAPITLRMTVVYGNVNVSPTASLSLPTIPKAPPAPSLVTTDNPDRITATSMRVRFSSNGTGGSAILEWQLQYAENAAFTVGVLNVTSTGTSTLTNLKPGTTYWVRARGRNAVGWGSYSTSRSATTLGAAPTAPTGLVLIPRPPDVIDVDWDVPTNSGGKPITGYDVQRAKNAAFTDELTQMSVGASPTDMDFPGGVPGTTYWVRVRAKNADAVGAWTTPLSTMIPAGGKAWTGTGWRNAVWRVWTGSLWKAGVVRVWDGTDWTIAN